MNDETQTDQVNKPPAPQASTVQTLPSPMY